MQIMAGHEAQSSRWEGTSASRSDFKTNDIYSLDAGDLKTATNGQYIGNNAMESYFARANFAYDSKYNLTFTGRNDGSSNFGPANRRGFFPSAAFAWTLSNESFMKSLPVISNLKFRLGWGIVGNANINSYAFGAALSSAPSQFGTTFVPDKIPNKTVKWESSNQINAGVDFGIYKDRLSVSLDVYDKTSSNFLYQLPLPMILGTQPWGGIAPPFVNLGEMNNKGIDLAVNAQILQQKDFNWNTNIIYSKYRNKLVSLVDESTAILRNVQWFNTVTKTSVGQPLGMFYGYRVEGIFKSEEELKTAPKQQKVDVNSTWIGDLRFKDLNGDGVIDGLDREIIGTPHPKFTMGMTNSFTYKGFDLSVFMNSSYGNNIFNYSRRETEGLSNPFSNQLKTVNDRWTPENPEGKLPRFQWGDGNDNRRISDRYIEDGSFVRVQNVSLGYKLPDVIARKLKMSKGRLYISGQNLKTFTKYTGLDPEIGSYNQDALLSNIDSGHYPVPRSYTMGINLEF
jgi:TonB-dependent starch-binding outer membrane protein SusC